MVENRESQTQVQERKSNGPHRSGNSAVQSHKRIEQFLKHRPVISNKGSGKHGKAFLFFGVILPLIAIGFELTTHFCAQHFFDPFPSASHVILFMLIPLSNFMAWLSGRRDMSPHYGFMALISGMAMGIGCLYALMFLPLTPHSAMYSLLFGFGLLGFAPLLSVPCTWLSGKTVCKLAASRKTFFDPHQVEHIGHLIVLCLVVAVELPSTLTRMNLSLAADPGTEKQGVQWLRQFGSEEVMLRACYERSGRATDILGSLYESGHPLSIESARSIFYKVTGKPFNSVPIPSAARATIQHAGLIDDPNGFNAGVKDEFDLDSDIAGENVSGVARGLTVTQSAVHGTVEPNAAVADLDWTATFSNSSPYDREARAKLLLPSDGVVTKATVTVNGVERDATILVRSLARTIYKQSVIDHKDPLLVSTCGVNQVLIQCFPVQPNSDMKVRLQIAAPLVISADKRTGSLMLPAFEERNFQFEQPVSVTFASNGRILPPVSKFLESGEKTSTGSRNGSTFAVEPSQIARLGGVVSFARNPEVSEVISNSKSGATGIVARAIIPTYKMPEKLAVIIDGSASMQRYIPELATALKALPAAVKAEIIVVGDDVESLGSNANPAAYATALGALEKYKALGGHADDNQLLNRIATSPVLWIHGSQPISSGNSKLLNDLLRRPANTPWLYDLQTVSGPNELLSGLEPQSNFVSVARVGKLHDDLNRLFSSWKTGVVKPSDNLKFADWIRPIDTSVLHPGVPNPVAPSATAPTITQSSKHDLEMEDVQIPGLTSLYGYQKLLESYKSDDITPALVLAEKYHLVSPVSSAVVMEYVPALHPSPVREGEKTAFNLPLKMPEFAKNEIDATRKKSDKDSGSFDPFSSVTAQLNNLSAAAESSADAGKTFQSAVTQAEPSADQKREVSTDQLQPIGDATGGGAKGLSGAPNEKPYAKSYPMKMKENVQYRSERKSGNDESFEAPPPQAAPAPPAMLSRSNAPMLEGATNGTIGPGDASLVENDKEIANKQAEQKSVASPDFAPWLGNLGVQPQVMEERQMKLESRQSLGMEGDGSRRNSLGLPDVHPMLWSALSIFVLIFMWIYAFFKLVKALAHK
ncbi:hypothetical protein BH10CYA1_BH10CYA1_37910 [soil metagenome]